MQHVLDALELKKLAQAKTLILRPFRFNPETDEIKLANQTDCFCFEMVIPKDKRIARASLNAKITAHVRGADEHATLRLVTEIYKAKTKLVTKNLLVKEDFNRQKVGKHVVKFRATDKFGDIEQININDASKIVFKIFLDSKTFKPCVSLMKSSLELVLTLE